jgi:hypothetical protein
MTRMIPKALLALALMAGCGSNSLQNVKEAPAPEDTTTTTTTDTGTARDPLSIDLRMRATGAETFAKLLLSATDVRVTADGIPVTVDLVGSLIDLADMANAAKVASFHLPEGAQNVEFVVELAPAGGFETKTDSGWVDTRQTELRFTSSAANLVEKGKAVIVFDAAKSVVPVEAGTVALVPMFRVRY